MAPWTGLHLIPGTEFRIFSVRLALWARASRTVFFSCTTKAFASGYPFIHSFIHPFLIQTDTSQQLNHSEKNKNKILAQGFKDDNCSSVLYWLCAWFKFSDFIDQVEILAQWRELRAPLPGPLTAPKWKMTVLEAPKKDLACGFTSQDPSCYLLLF